eukprot:5666281-Prymnesium_polylepis.1
MAPRCAATSDDGSDAPHAATGGVAAVPSALARLPGAGDFKHWGEARTRARAFAPPCPSMGVPKGARGGAGAGGASAGALRPSVPSLLVACGAADTGQVRAGPSVSAMDTLDTDVGRSHGDAAPGALPCLGDTAAGAPPSSPLCDDGVDGVEGGAEGRLARP